MANLSVNEHLRKTLDTSAGTTGAVLINEEIERQIHESVLRATPLLGAISHRRAATNAVEVRIRATDPDAFALADNETPPAADAGTFVKETFIMKYLYSRVSVTGPEQAATSNWIDIMSDQIDAGIASLGRFVQNMVVSGNSTTNSKHFDGLQNQIVTNVVPAAGPLLTTQIDEALDLPEVTPTRIAGIKAHGRRVNQILQAQQRFVDRSEIDGGFRVPTYRDVPIILMDSAFNTSMADSLLFFEHSRTRLYTQRDTFMLEMGRTKDADDYLMGMYATLAVVDENWHTAKITGITA